MMLVLLTRCVVCVHVYSGTSINAANVQNETLELSVFVQREVRSEAFKEKPNETIKKRNWSNEDSCDLWVSQCV